MFHQNKSGIEVLNLKNNISSKDFKQKDNLKFQLNELLAELDKVKGKLPDLTKLIDNLEELDKIKGKLTPNLIKLIDAFALECFSCNRESLEFIADQYREIDDCKLTGNKFEKLDKLLIIRLENLIANVASKKIDPDALKKIIGLYQLRITALKLKNPETIDQLKKELRLSANSNPLEFIRKMQTQLPFLFRFSSLTDEEFSQFVTFLADYSYIDKQDPLLLQQFNLLVYLKKFTLGFINRPYELPNFIEAIKNVSESEDILKKMSVYFFDEEETNIHLPIFIKGLNDDWLKVEFKFVIFDYLKSNMHRFQKEERKIVLSCADSLQADVEEDNSYYYASSDPLVQKAILNSHNEVINYDIDKQMKKMKKYYAKDMASQQRDLIDIDDEDNDPFEFTAEDKEPEINPYLNSDDDSESEKEKEDDKPTPSKKSPLTELCIFASDLQTTADLTMDQLLEEKNCTQSITEDQVVKLQFENSKLANRFIGLLEDMKLPSTENIKKILLKGNSVILRKTQYNELIEQVAGIKDAYEQFEEKYFLSLG